MRQRSLIAITAALAAGALTLTACGSRDSGDKGSDSNGGGTTVVIGVDAPLTGDLSALGLGIRNSVDLAAKQANKKNYVKGVTFKIEAADDQAQPSSGQSNATKFVGEKDVLGVVGPLNSSVAQSMQKVFDDAKLVEVSPANTNPALTQGDDWQKSKTRAYKSYFRTATTDAIQGPFAAQYVYNKAKKKKAFIIDDKKTYGAGLAATFSDEFKKLGGKIVGTEHINPDTKDFSAVATKVKNSGAQVVYYGGEYPQAGPLSKQIKAAGAKIPLVGGDGIYADDFIKLAGASGTGDLATSVGAPVETLPSAKEFVANYKAGGYKEAYAAYGGYSYDSAWSIIEAVKKVVDDNGGKLPDDARAKVTEAMQNVSFDGVTGKVSFDEYGDATNKQLTVYSVTGGAWKAVESGTYNGS
ncbi:branched-chain amino acid ABC transporter substrate-binding protein [Streptomyces sp. NPDC059688]|uniref:Branched-chain amino acid ABC transporter substrate-binding protein n=2 Tax=Streptomyces TaxID=1883 RepID=A0ABV1U9Y2_9ACTN|nr:MULTISPECIES: branched-chain amino acid ABC transporter substrate-binding protein [unclassified Streptomyces]OKJ83022.1 branched-chain amino acid ABC transporter substrate-binding protein [Streptomyces sp. CB01883]PKW07157.1 amino acid/amide ABC transporter substrate-binding protein (HAAT family) [Streptomyces sp. 5112.2]UXY35252.1 branched-chain amino acid ABC transporter substrate-binding protein [Streptomyces sp. HUAS 14-6]SEC79249.1 branched-chain amino acid transport system substrate-bi